MKYTAELGKEIGEQYATGKHSVEAICNAVKINRDTFYEWKSKYKSFEKLINNAHSLRLEAIGDLALSGLALLVTKHEYEEVTTEYTEGKDGKPKIKGKKVTKKFVMPNPGMITLALTNRKPEDWKQKQAVDLKLTVEQPLFGDGNNG